MTDVASNLRQKAEIKKGEGNSFFLKDDLVSAIAAYSDAIKLCPTVPAFYTNRALCHKKRSDWGNVEADCRKAVELERDSLKAHYMLGLVHLHYERYAEAIRELEKAMELARSSKAGTMMIEEIWNELCKAKYTQWQADSESRKERWNRSREYIKSLMQADFESQRKNIDQGLPPRSPNEMPPIFELFGRLPSFIFPHDCASQSQPESSAGHSFPAGGDAGASREELLRQLSDAHAEHVNTFENVFESAGASDRPCEIPDHLCCPITMEIFRDPVITPAGVTYERAVLLQHFKRGKDFDPVTRLPMTEAQIVPNLAMRESVLHFLNEHGWAYHPLH